VCDKHIASHTVFLHILQFCVDCKDNVLANKQLKMVVRLWPVKNGLDILWSLPSTVLIFENCDEGVMPCILLEWHQHFRGTCWLHLEGRREE